jgi:hypothetical protein
MFCFCYVFKFVSKQCSSSISKYFFSSISCLNSSPFFHFNLVSFLKFQISHKQSNLLLLCSCLIYLNPCNCFCGLPLFPCEFLIRAFSCHHPHPPPLQKTLNQRPPNLLNKHKQWEQKAMPLLHAKRHKIQSLQLFWNGNVTIAPL